MCRAVAAGEQSVAQVSYSYVYRPRLERSRIARDAVDAQLAC